MPPGNKQKLLLKITIFPKIGAYFRKYHKIYKVKTVLLIKDY